MKNSQRALRKSARQPAKAEDEASPRGRSAGRDGRLGRESSSNQARVELAAIVESSDDAILSKDLDGIIHSWNKGAERIYGYSAAEMMGRHVSSLVPPGYPDDTPEIMRRLRLGERI
ncbi:MAG TPA: PAS domain S-box protein, partial [Terriglobales bacterium]|nr:PAS domain S-box protein [Terriglobales bacterium]